MKDKLCALLTSLCLCLLAAATAQAQSAAAQPQSGPAISQADCSQASEIVLAAYLQVLERPPDMEKAKAQSERLQQGALSVRELVRELALSTDYEKRFIQQRSIEQALQLLYQHLLARGSVAQREQQRWAEVAKVQGFTAVINGLIDGPEYGRDFGARGVPGRPAKFISCKYPLKLKRDEMVSNGQHLTTEVKVGSDGQVDGVSHLNNLVILNGFCARVALWVLDEHDQVIEIIGPASDSLWCVKSKSEGESERTEEWHAKLSPEKLKRASSFAILQTLASKNPRAMTRENVEKVRQLKQSVN